MTYKFSNTVFLVARRKLQENELKKKVPLTYKQKPMLKVENMNRIKDKEFTPEI